MSTCSPATARLRSITPGEADRRPGGAPAGTTAGPVGRAAGHEHRAVLLGLAAKAIPELGLAACAAGVVAAVAATDRLPGMHPPA